MSLNATNLKFSGCIPFFILLSLNASDFLWVQMYIFLQEPAIYILKIDALKIVSLTVTKGIPNLLTFVNNLKLK